MPASCFQGRLWLGVPNKQGSLGGKGQSGSKRTQGVGSAGLLLNSWHFVKLKFVFTGSWHIIIPQGGCQKVTFLTMHSSFNLNVNQFNTYDKLLDSQKLQKTYFIHVVQWDPKMNEIPNIYGAAS